MSLGNSILSKLKISIILLTVFACGTPRQPLPIIGKKQINNQGEEIDHTVSQFEFINQNNEKVTQEKFKNKVYIADFFFTSCKTICPKMTDQLTRVQKELRGEDYFILSHTVNPTYDTSSVLLDYSKRMNADLYNWDFVTGDAQKIYKQAASYQVIALKDTTVPIPFVHSEYLVLVDKKSRVRGLYDGTNIQEVNQLIKDTKWLIRH